MALIQLQFMLKNWNWLPRRQLYELHEFAMATMLPRLQGATQAGSGIGP